MNETSDRRLSWQPDIYQRYGLLARLTDVLLDDASGGGLTLLDVGSGPVALTAAFISDRFTIVRADVSQFGDPAIVLLEPGARLPFEDGAFDVAVAVEVLEHVPPADRAGFVQELQRVARRAVILSCPVDAPEIVEAERTFAAWARSVSGRDVDFLVEHEEHGLPDAGQVRSWFCDPASVLVADNAPLDEWLALNLLDFLYACDLGDGDAKQRFSAEVNAGTPFARTGAAHYRRFFCAFSSPAHAVAAAQVIEEVSAPGASDSLRVVHGVIAGLLALREGLLARSDRDVTALRTHINELDQMLARLKTAIEEKDTHIGKLDVLIAAVSQHLAAANAAIGDKDARFVELESDAAALRQALSNAQAEGEALTASLARRDERIASLEHARARDRSSSASLAAALRDLLSEPSENAAEEDALSEAQRHAGALRVEITEARDRLERDARALAERQASLDEATRRAATLESELQSVLTSRSWRLTAPMRRFSEAFRRPAALAGARRRLSAAYLWMRERITRRRSYATVVASGLFDPAWYRVRYPDVAQTGIDPLVHYLKRGAVEGRDPHPLFDTVHYLSQTGPLAAGTSPLLHYLLVGAREGRQPHPLFDGWFYRRRYADVSEAAVNPLAHYFTRGWREGRDPHPLFSTSYYLERNPEVAAAGVNPLVHYLTTGVREGRDPHPLFDSAFYTQSNPDVVSGGWNPVIHYLAYGGFQGRDPHALFDSSFYLDANGDVAAAGLNPLVHYVESGGVERRNPHPHFDSAFYLSSHPDVAAAGLNPLVHYVLEGRRDGHAPLADGAAPGRAYVPARGRLPWFDPLNVALSPQLADMPRLNVLVPGLAMRHLSGGPNTALEVAGRLALAGVRVRLISTDAPLDGDAAPFRGHLRRLLGADLPADLEIVSAHDRSVPLAIGERDIFMATAWWTAQQAKYAIRLTKHSRFVYLIQDYEPLLHPASTQQALANETYSLDHLPVVNSRPLHEFLVSQRIGRFADPQFAERSLVFQPAVDRALFFPDSRRPAATRRRLLFYARPTNGLRNLFELGVAALEKAVADGTLDPERWELLGMGESFASVSLGRGAILAPAPWLDLAGYARQMRESDILLSLMLSPHPSYPPLEMAACGGLAVTTAFANKDAATLAALSPNIIGVAPTLEGISEGIGRAVARLDDIDERRAGAAIDLPASWRESLSQVVPRLREELALLQGSPARNGHRGEAGSGGSIVAAGFGNWPRDEYEAHRLSAFARRRTQYPARPEPGLLSLLTPVWNSPPAYLDELADSIIGQDAPATFEWIVLDNGSDDPGTRAALERLRAAPCVRFHRSERNLGIIEGTRFCLERATSRYTATVDHDDLLTPDCVRVVSHALRQAGYPALAYTDEDKLDGDRFSLPYLKPQFDPVLFASSCYIAHLSIVDRSLALQLGAYTDRQAEGSHDWDTFTRFVLAGHTPVHIPEVLYSWRIHQGSTAGNFRSKPFVYDSQRRVLTKLLAGLPGSERFRLEPSPLFGGTPDWWMRRDASHPRRITTVVLGAAAGGASDLAVSPGVPHDLVYLDPREGIAGLAQVAAQAAADGRLLHVVWHDTRIVDECWALEAMGLFELYPDTVMVGGRLHQNGRILHAGAYFGFGRGCDAPDRGRPLDDPGYFAHVWKPHSVSAVALDHCVIDASFAADALASRVPAGVALDQLGAWLGAAARRMDRRVVYTPFLSASPAVDRGSDISSVAREAFLTVNRDLMPDPILRSPHAALRRGQALRSRQDLDRAVPGEPEIALSYDQHLAADRLARGVAEPAAARDLTFSVLTSVYTKTPVEFFRQTAASLLGQTHARFEWVLLENGPISSELSAVLDEQAGDSRVQRFACPVNVGIQGAMRACLARAQGDYVIPLDADDLLEPDALAIMASTIVTAQADFVFSDEDHLADGKLHARYSRPGFDPVLNLESSYVWHVTAFRRDRALALGIYEDPAAEYCHDWDTITRFARAGAAIAHVPHVLYHWRSHEVSSSHRATQNPGTIASTRALLERVVAAQPLPSIYEVAEYPIPRGAVEWWIRRLPTADVSCGVVLLKAEDPSPVSTCDGFAPARVTVALPFGIKELDDWRALGDALPRDVELVAVLDARWRPDGDAWLLEAAKWFELQPDTAVVGGRLVGDDEVVVDAGRAVRSGSVVPAYRGMKRDDPGSFSLALKAQTIHAPASGCFVARRQFLQGAIESVLRDGFTSPFVVTLGELARASGLRVVYSPLIEARRVHAARGRAAARPAGTQAPAPSETRLVASV